MQSFTAGADASCPGSAPPLRKNAATRRLRISHWAAGVFHAAIVLACPATTHAQTYPNKIIRLITAEAAGGSDVIARIIAHGLAPRVGQQVIVENRGGLVGGETAAKASADGYSLLVYGSSIWLLPFMRSNIPWDPVRNFAPVTHAVSTPSVLAVNPTVPAKTIKEFIALAKAKPGEFNYATASTGSVNHLASELFKSMAGVNIVWVPYKGTGPALTALIAGDVQMIITSAGSLSPHIKSGRLRGLAATTATPTPLAPDLPTLAASGLPGYEAVSAFGVWSPMGAPKPIITLLNKEIVGVLTTPDVRQKFLAAGIEVVASTPEDFDKLIRREMARFGKIIKDLGIRAE
jgi:tripartite-type tricarboxylate transporter receptor subunit TctC